MDRLMDRLGLVGAIYGITMASILDPDFGLRCVDKTFGAMRFG